MTDDEEPQEPAVELGEHTPVEGAPLARVSSRLHWPMTASDVERQEGDSVIRTPDGPQELSSIMAQVEETYFERRQGFEAAVRDVIGTGSVQTAE